MTDTYADGTPSIITCLKPKRHGWVEFQLPPASPLRQMGYPVRVYRHTRSMITVFSAVEVTSDSVVGGPEYHLSISRDGRDGTERVDSNDARWALGEFSIEGAREDNHVPYGLVRNFWRPVAGNWVGVRCRCEDDEPKITENKGDFVWRGAPK